MNEDKKQPLSEYQAFVKDKHERLFNTPHEIINAAVKEATGSEIIEKDRIIKGESNEVHAIRTESGQEIIARISRSDQPKFETEKWAIEQCAAIGVPVPKVLLIKDFELDGKPLEISIQNKLPGTPLKEIEELLFPVNSDRLLDILYQAGQLLYKIHSIKTEGFGELDKFGHGEFNSISPVLSSDFYNEAEMLKVATAVDLPPETIIRALEILKTGAANYPTIQSKLTHNDFAPKHILVDKDKITGIIDFEIVEGGDPIREFARWEFFTGNGYPIEALQKGYNDTELFGSDYENRFNLWKIYLGVANLHYYAEEKNQAGIRLAKGRLLEDIKYFK